jgi:hypothetical protein
MILPEAEPEAGCESVAEMELVAPTEDIGEK